MALPTVSTESVFPGFIPEEPNQPLSTGTGTIMRPRMLSTAIAV